MNIPIAVLSADTTLNQLLQHELSKHGYTVQCAEEREGALALIHASLPSLIVLGNRLSDTSGFDLLGTLRNHPETRSIPVMMLVDSEPPTDLLHGLRIGVADCLAKPFLLAELVARLERLLPVTRMLDADSPEESAYTDSGHSGRPS